MAWLIPHDLRNIYSIKRVDNLVGAVSECESKQQAAIVDGISGSC